MSAAEVLLARLNGVRATGRGSWAAKCPAHEDRMPSLSIRDAGERVLLCCHAGCTAGDVVAALGMTLSDLFEKPLDHLRRPVASPLRPRINAAELLAQIQHESLVVVVVAERLVGGEPLAPDDYRRLIRAAANINSAVSKSIQPESPESRNLRRGDYEVRAR